MSQLPENKPLSDSDLRYVLDSLATIMNRVEPGTTPCNWSADRFFLLALKATFDQLSAHTDCFTPGQEADARDLFSQFGIHDRNFFAPVVH